MKEGVTYKNQTKPFVSRIWLLVSGLFCQNKPKSVSSVKSVVSSILSKQSHFISVAPCAPLWQEMQNKPKYPHYQSKNKVCQKNKPKSNTFLGSLCRLTKRTQTGNRDHENTKQSQLI
jgi:hypothetical protein